MRKSVVPRIFLFLLLNCAVFVLLAAMQFTRQGNFSQRIGGMIINGHYSPSDETPEEGGKRPLDGGASVFFGGLEFRLVFSPELDVDTGFSLVGANGERRLVFPETIAFKENEVVFALPGGGELSFATQTGNSPNGTPELRINGKFSRGISAIDIPFRPQRSSVIRDNDRGIFSISYNGSRYQFSRSQQGLEAGRLVLLTSSPAITYRAVTGKADNNPADFILPQAQTVAAFNAALDLWTAGNLEAWGRNLQVDEDMVIAWCAEGLRQGRYRAAASAVPTAFGSSPDRSWESSVYQFDRRVGVWERAARAISEQDREKTNSITKLLAERDIAVFKETRLIEFLAIRDNNNLMNRLTAFAREIDPFEITLETSPGILECHTDMSRWRPLTNNPFEALADAASLIAAEGLHRSGDQIFVVTDGLVDTEFNLRLGKALHEWGEKFRKADWAGLGRSLVLSVIALDNGGSVPALLTVSSKGEFITTPASMIGSAGMYRFLIGNENLPHAAATGASGIWAWTAASSVTVTQNDQQMDIRVSFPVGETHYLVLRNVKPFPLLQIYDSNWRRAYDFESYYDSSGWYYFESDQTLVVKLRHRSNVELVRILFVAPPPPPPPPPPPSEEEMEEAPVERSYERQAAENLQQGDTHE